MKKITLSFLLICSSFLFAQVTYTSSNFAGVGDELLVSNATAAGLTLDYIQTGTNYTWDYATLAPLSQESVLWQNPNNAGYKNIWCLLNGYFFNCNSQFNNNFNLATKLTNGLVIQGMGLTNVVDHLNKTTGLLANKMVGAQITMNGSTIPFVASYQSPDVLYQFPINFNDTYTNPIALNVNLNSFGVPIQLGITGNRTNTVEGWGSLITPYGTYASVLKIKSTLVQQITITTAAGPQVIDQTTVSYEWFDPAFKIPVLQVSGNLVANQWIPSSVRYFDIERCLQPDASFIPIPLTADFNPANNNASITFVNNSINYDILSWNFGDSTPTSSVENPTHNFLCPGTREVTLTITNQFCDPDQVDTITIPVVITDSQNAFTTSVTVTGTTLTADRTLAGTSYQWLDCNNNNLPISGQTNQVFTPSQDGNYAVQLTTNGCVSSSNCVEFTSLNNPNFDLANSINVIPNPTSGLLTFSTSIEIESVEIYNTLGELISTKPDLSNFSNGIYILKINTKTGTAIKKIIKE
jgi:PKD repeat protein